MAETHEVSRREFKKLMYRAGEGIFFGNGFHRACLTLLNNFPGALSFCDVCVLVRVLF